MGNKIPSWSIALVILIGAYIFLRFIAGLPIPLVNFFMLFILAGTIIHITLDDKRIEELKGILDFLAGTKAKANPVTAIVRGVVLLIVPFIAAYIVYDRVKISYKPPAEIFTPHPTPPGWVVGFKVSEWAADPDKWDIKFIEEGKKIYEDHCASCHGKEADGKGPEARALRYPIPPTNFKDPATISMIQLSYAYWRVRDGGIHDKQFNSSMPGWGDELEEDEIWKVIMYSYHKAGVRPRTW
jgi:cytochrome c553